MARIGHGFEAFFVEEFMPKQKFVQQHSGDWAMTGKCSVAGRKLNSSCPHQPEG